MHLSNSSSSLGTLFKFHRKKRSLTQRFIADYLGIDHTIISKIESGKFIPHLTTVRSFCLVLKLTEAEANELENAQINSILEREGISSEKIFVSSEEAINFGLQLVQNTSSFRINGMPKLAVANAESKLELLHLVANRCKNENHQKELFKILNDLLMEVGKSYMDFLEPKDVWDYMGPLISYQEAIIPHIDSTSARYFVDITIESALYVSKNYKAAHELGTKLHTYIESFSTKWQFEILRAMAINSGYLRNASEVDLLKKEIDSKIEKSGNTKPLDAAFMLEGLARGQSMLSELDALSSIEKAWSYIDRSKKKGISSPLKTVQLIRTQLRVFKALKYSNKAEIEKIGSKGLLLCDELGYSRYNKEISQLMNDLLNS